VTQTELHQPLESPPPPIGGPSPHGELGDVIRRLLRSWWIILLCAVIALAVAFEVDKRMANTYQATTYVILSTSDFQQAVGGASTQANPLGQEATAIASLTPVREANAAQAAGLGPSDNYSLNVASTGSNSSILAVNGVTSSPRTAAALADAAAQQMIDVVKQSNAASINDARATVQAQLKAARPRFKQTLAAQLNSFDTLQALANQSIQIMQRAQIPASADKPSKARTGGIALVLGLILGMAIAVLRRPRATSF
jgi:uncharacterized protein involved in exopolysaccharide biosynthesis